MIDNPHQTATWEELIAAGKIKRQERLNLKRPIRRPLAYNEPVNRREARIAEIRAIAHVRQQRLEKTK